MAEIKNPRAVKSMKIQKKIKMCFTAIIFVILSFSGIAYAESADTLTVICRKEDVVLSNMNWKIYRVADITNGGDYRINDIFGKYNISFEKSSVSSLQEAAAKYETYTILDNLKPLDQGATDSNGQVVFSGLEVGLYLLIGDPVRVNELAYVPMPSLIDLSDSDGEGTSWTYDLTALPKLKVLPANDLIKSKYNVVKKWVNDTEGIRPEYVTAVLYRNGVEFDSAVLNDDNNWEHTWSNLPATADWSIKEKEIPFGYEVTYEESEQTVTIVNDYKENPTDSSDDRNDKSSGSSGEGQSNAEKLPQTGLLLWPVLALAVAGIILFTAGYIVYKRGKNEK